MSGERDKVPLLNPTLRWFLLAMILANIASEMVYALLAVYLVELGAGVAQVGLALSASSVVLLCLQILGGYLSDSMGRLRTIAIGSVGGTIGYVCLLLAPSWRWGLLAICLEYVAGALVGPSFGALIAEQSAEESRGRVFGLTKGIFMIVAVVGPLLGGLLAHRHGFRGMLTVACLVYGAAAVLRLWMARTIRFAGRSVPHSINLPSLRSQMATMLGMLTAGGLLTWVLVTDGVRDVAFRLSMDLQPLYLTQVGGFTVEQVGWLRSLAGLAMMLVMLPAGWLSDRRSERLAIAVGFFVQSLGLVAFVRADRLAGFVLAACLFGLGAGLMLPAYDSLVSKAVPEAMRGIGFGLFHSSIGLISMPAPWLGAQLWVRFRPQTPFLLTALAALVCTVPAWFKFVLPAARQKTPNGT